jgi:hypothetical protein
MRIYAFLPGIILPVGGQTSALCCSQPSDLPSETDFICPTLDMAVVQLVEALRYKPEGCGFDSQMVSLEFLIDIMLSTALWP